MPGGRPAKWKSVDEIIGPAEKYFAETIPEEWTITGLALALDTCRDTLIEYTNKKEEFSDTIRKYKQMVHMSYEISLKRRGNSGDIFALKNFGWKDDKGLDVTTKGNEIKGFNYLPPTLE